MPKPKIRFIQNYKQGLKILMIALLALLLISWLMNINPTYKLYKANQKYQSKLKQSENADNEIVDLKNRLESLAKVAIKSYDRDVLLESVTTFCKSKNMLIKNFPATEKNALNGIEYMTNVIEVEGSYKNIVELAYMLEHEKMLGSVASLKFNSLEDRIEKKTYLLGSIILRNIKS